ncbi:DUF1816 domain-containing protein [Gloeothece verrucosa]|uniref:DUF1816 domain-containing protein n=1 Tax=Gloeothece verrucosa (strain PCC 7822) TaxID=497965 RepID=E0UBH0_GLOV7|nr:DUF1816 domain-containing protein [Gloeothece verrucosa]ADN12802.1 Domain of unknown function DUF1816 [Gloeothece verrucosa PCC 7822]
MKELLTKIFTFLGLAYWVEIQTDYPRCIYYFGPFFTKKEADEAKMGYLEDLEHEGAKGISVVSKRCKPSKLTIFDEKEEFKQIRVIPSLSSQIS